ncbi:MAG: CHAT domain-containing protein [Sphingobacteriia bacterium]|nr:CHAT domain-containing protein [Sphingobacteriia bacterium]
MPFKLMIGCWPPPILVQREVEAQMDTLEITIQYRRDDYYPVVAVHRSPAHLPIREQHRLACGPSAGAFLERLLPLPPEVYGRLLAEAVFTAPIRDLYRAARAADLRVLLVVEDPSLRSIRWERLCGPDDEGFLLLDQHTPYSRFLPSTSPYRYPSIGPGALKALVVLANPPQDNVPGLSRFPADQAGHDLAEQLAPITVEQLGSHPDAVAPANLDGIAERLTAGRHGILHIVAHGKVKTREDGETLLYLTGPDGSLEAVTGSELIDRLRRLPLPHLVFLAACEGASADAEEAMGALAQNLVRRLGTPAVVAMTAPVSIRTAFTIAARFYTYLLETGHPDLALVKARAGLQEAWPDLLVPALFGRLGDLPLFRDGLEDNRPLTPDEIDHGLMRMRALLPERAPVMLSAFDKAAANLLRLRTSHLGGSRASEHARAEALAELDRIAEECLDLGFRPLALGIEPPVLDGLCERPGACPFPGLAPFSTEELRAFFFGREKTIAQVLEKLLDERFVAVLGPSGSGKSSLVFAGLVPAFADSPADAAISERRMVPGADPESALARVLSEPLSEDRDTLLIVDQLEELFTQCRDDARRKGFVDALHRAWQHEKRLYLALTMREDFHRDCAALPVLTQLINAHHVLISPMGTDELRSAMEQQAEAVCLRFEDGLSHDILKEIAGEPGAMPLLQHLLLELWKRRHGRWLRRSEYLDPELGGVRGAIARTAEAAYSDYRADAVSRALFRDLFLRLTRLDDRGVDGETRDTRQRLPISRVTPSGVDPEAVERLVQDLAGRGLLTTSPDPDTNETRVEVSHEALIRHWSRLQTWIGENREALLLIASVRQQTWDWADHGRRSADLPRWSQRLKQVESLHQRPEHWPTPVEREFVASARRLARRNRLVIGGLVVSVAVVALVASLVVWWQQEKARLLEDKARIAEQANARANGLQAMRNAAEYREGNALLAAHNFAQAVSEFHKAGDQERVKNALLGLKFQTYLKLESVVEHDGWQGGGLLSPDASRAVTWDQYGDDARLWAVDSEHSLSEIGSFGHYAVSARFNSDGRRLLIWGAGQAKACDGLIGLDCVSKALSSSNESRLDPSLSADGTRLLTRDDEGFHLWDLTKGGVEIASPVLPTEPVLYAHLNFDGSRILAQGPRFTTLLDSVSAEQISEQIQTGFGPDEDRMFRVQPVMRPDGHQFATLALNDIALWNAQSGARLDRIPVPRTPEFPILIDARFDQNGAALLVWESLEAEEAESLTWWIDLAGHADPEISPIIADRGTRVAQNDDRTAAVFWPESGNAEFWSRQLSDDVRIPIPSAIADNTSVPIVADVRFVPGGSSFVVLDQNGTTRTWRTRLHEPPRFVARERSSVSDGAVSLCANGSSGTCSADGTRKLSWDDTGGLTITELTRQQPVPQLAPDGARIIDATLSGDGGTLLVHVDNGGEERVLLWDLNAGKRYEPVLECGFICSFFLSYDGRRAFVRRGQDWVDCWDRETQCSCGSVLLPKHGASFDADISPSGVGMLNRDIGEPIRMFDLETTLDLISPIGQEILDNTDTRGTGKLGAAFNPTGNRIVVWLDYAMMEDMPAQPVAVYDASTGVRLTPLLRPNDCDITEVALSHDDQLIVSCKDDTDRILDLSVVERWPAEEMPLKLRVETGTEPNKQVARVLHAEGWQRERCRYDQVRGELGLILPEEWQQIRKRCHSMPEPADESRACSTGTASNQTE